MDFKKAIDKFSVISDLEHFEFSKNAIKEKKKYSMKSYVEEIVNLHTK